MGSYCNYQTKDQISLTAHANTHEAKHMCEECGYKYKSVQALKIHKKRVHTKNYKFHECSHCDLKFERKEKLNAHLSLLSGVKPFHCRLCNNGYTLFSCLLKHFRRHHIGET